MRLSNTPDRQLYGGHFAREMKTDVHEHDDHYEVDIDLPGFQKDQIQLSLEIGYLTVTAMKEVEKDKTKKGKTIRQERYDGTLQRASMWAMRLRRKISPQSWSMVC